MSPQYFRQYQTNSDTSQLPCDRSSTTGNHARHFGERRKERWRPSKILAVKLAELHPAISPRCFAVISEFRGRSGPIFHEPRTAKPRGNGLGPNKKHESMADAGRGRNAPRRRGAHLARGSSARKLRKSLRRQFRWAEWPAKQTVVASEQSRRKQRIVRGVRGRGEDDRSSSGAR